MTELLHAQLATANRAIVSVLSYLLMQKGGNRLDAMTGTIMTPIILWKNV